MKARSALLAAAVVLAPLGASFLGAPGPLLLGLNLGPGDDPYLSGFLPEYEIEGGNGLHWSRPHARVSLPLAFSGSAELSLRFGPPPGGPSRVEVELDDRPLGAFDCCRHRALQRRRFEVAEGASPAVPPQRWSSGPHRTPVRIGLRVQGSEVTDRGLFLDRVDLDLRSGARVWLRGTASYRPALVVGLSSLVLLLAGFSLPRAALLLVPLSALLVHGLLRDPWLVHRLLTHLPEALLLVLVPLAALGRLQATRLDPRALRAGTALALLAFLARGAALNHPDFYYPDLMVHARLVSVAREAGSRLWLTPHEVLYTARETPSPTDTLVRATSGLWLRRIGDRSVGLPYSLAFHALLAPFAGSLDATVSLLKTVGALLSVVPIVALAFLASRVLLSPWAAALLVAAPTSFAELTLGTVPATFGHALDVLFLLWLARRVSRGEGSEVLPGALVLGALQVAYVSSALTGPALLAAWGLLLWRDQPRRARDLGLTLAAGSALAGALYYRAFLPDGLAALRLALGGAGLRSGLAAGGPEDAGGGRVDAAFLLWAFPLAVVPAAIFFVRLARGPTAGPVLAWGLACGILGVARAVAPQVFGFVHLALFATPLVALCAGAGLVELRERGRWPGAAALVLFFLMGALGLALQWRALLAQLGHAR